ncbi:zinc finger protein ZFP2-like isoform X1 [Uranotaenia lowii]|uniref:zinc finger protein ZFP2-like isoform X1 n=2 Tax=Uranotaenia lowii TaxID=190385 RepID=UPI00247A833C|nr:zinc finger protein ZFP2-like isoform X1 [Uranotaenia lowii]
MSNMPCIVPTCRTPAATLVPFPSNPKLAERWSEAIQVGCEILGAVNFGKNTIHQICESHFCAATNDYQEPSLFVNSKSKKVQIVCCRMCLRFHPITKSLPKSGHIGKDDISSFIMETMNIDVNDSSYFNFICECCFARIDICKVILSSFLDADRCFQELKNHITAQELEFLVKDEATIYQTISDSEELLSESMDDERMEDENKSESETELNYDSEDSLIEMVENDTTLSDGSDTKKDSINDKRPKRYKNGAFRRTLRKKYLESNETDSDNLTLLLAKKCYICQKVWPDANALNEHLTAQHATITDYRCEECNEDCLTIGSYNRHLAKHDKSERPHKCNFCPYRFVHNVNMRRHEMAVHNVKHNVKPYSKHIVRSILCEHCGASFRYSTKLTTHIRIHHLNKKLTCSICNQSFTTNFSLERHMLIHNNQKPHVCATCGESFRRLLDLKHHMEKVHEGRNPHVCTECNKEFKTYYTLCTHRSQVHKGNPPQPSRQSNNVSIECSVCSVIFPTHRELGQHIEDCHSKNYPYFECNVCQEKFITKRLLYLHKALHTDKFECKICEKRFQTKQRLQQHDDAHHNTERKYKCSICTDNRFYKNISSLKNHMTIHRRGKIFPCEFCDKSFARKDVLKIHRRTHTGEKPFECPVCQKHFGDNGTFSKHKKRCLSNAASMGGKTLMQ